MPQRHRQSVILVTFSTRRTSTPRACNLAMRAGQSVTGRGPEKSARQGVAISFGYLGSGPIVRIVRTACLGKRLALKWPISMQWTVGYRAIPDIGPQIPDTLQAHGLDGLPRACRSGQGAGHDLAGRYRRLIAAHRGHPILGSSFGASVRRARLGDIDALATNGHVKKLHGSD